MNGRLYTLSVIGEYRDGELIRWLPYTVWCGQSYDEAGLRAARLRRRGYEVRVTCGGRPI